MKIGFTLKPRNAQIDDLKKQLVFFENLGAGSVEIPFNKIFSTFSFPSDIFLNFELSDRYQRYYQSNYESAKKLISLIK